jgi:16S rRNA (cytosine1402-N4)-methyltransferase
MDAAAPHVPVLIGPLVRAVAPVGGVWLDGTFGAGGYTRALLAAGAARVIAVDRDPDALSAAGDWAAEDGRVTLCAGRFGELDRIAADAGVPGLDGVVLDIGVSSMQLDQAARGFSFMRDGPLDMRMEQAGPSAADVVNRASEALIADILYRLGEEHAARRIARAVVAARAAGPITRTLDLARLIERVVPRGKPGNPHPATRSFQALRIAVNDELGELARGLAAAERALKAGGHLAVVTFHSLEDRMVKRFLQLRSGRAAGASRHAPEVPRIDPGFDMVTPRAVAPDAAEIDANPRARSAKLRVARRRAAAFAPVDPADLGLPALDLAPVARLAPAAPPFPVVQNRGVP